MHKVILQLREPLLRSQEVLFCKVSMVGAAGLAALDLCLKKNH
jgi:hypothetical protein